MKSHWINICSIMPVEFFPGHLYLVEAKKVFEEKEWLYSDAACYINFPFEGSIRAIPFFDAMKQGDRERILLHIQDRYGFTIRTDDMFGKLMVTVFYYLETYNVLIVGLAGLGDNSINAYIDWLQQVVIRENDKLIILTSSFGQQGRIAVTLF